MRYMLESYLPRPHEDLQALARRARAAAGESLRYIDTIFVPEDEMCLLIFEADSEQDVREAVRGAGIPFERVLETRGEEIR